MGRKKLLIFYVLFALVAFSAIGATVLQVFLLKTKPPLIQHIPNFQLIERSGKSISLADLKGKVWLADFIYSTCPGPCPMISSRLAGLQEQALKNGAVRFVSFTVNPETDTPEVLREYAAKYQARTDRWFFVTGDPAQVRSLIQTGFHLAAAPGSTGDQEVVHSTRIALVDRSGGIRHYYDALTEKDETILHDLENLLREK
jgi:protein SCO1/2